MQFPAGPGYVVQEAKVPLNIVRELGGEWVVIVWGAALSLSGVLDIINWYAPLGLNVLTLSSADQAELLGSMAPSVLPSFLNEPDEADQSNLSPDDYMVQAAIATQSIPPDRMIGPNCGDLSQSWMSRFKMIGGPSKFFCYTYHTDESQLNLFYENEATISRQMGKPAHCTEIDPHTGTSPSIADFAASVVLNRINAAIYQLPDSGSLASPANDGFVNLSGGQYVLNAQGTSLLAKIQAGIPYHA